MTVSGINSKTLFNLTIREVGAVLGFIAMLFIVWMNLNVKIANIESKNAEIQKDIIRLSEEITTNRNERNDQIQMLRSENANEHRQLMEGQNKILDYIINRK